MPASVSMMNPLVLPANPSASTPSSPGRRSHRGPRRRRRAVSVERPRAWPRPSRVLSGASADTAAPSRRAPEPRRAPLAKTARFHNRQGGGEKRDHRKATIVNFRNYLMFSTGTTRAPFEAPLPRCRPQTPFLRHKLIAIPKHTSPISPRITAKGSAHLERRRR